MEKRNIIIYWVATGLMCFIIGASAFNYLKDYQSIVKIFKELSYPVQIIIPLAIAKLLAIVAILTKKSNFLKEWAYAGIFFNASIALMAHIVAADKQWLGAVLVLVLMTVSYIFDKKVFA